MKLIELVKRKFVHLNLVYLSHMAAPTIEAACTIAETETVLTIPKQIVKLGDNTESWSKLLDIS